MRVCVRLLNKITINIHEIFSVELLSRLYETSTNRQRTFRHYHSRCAIVSIAIRTLYTLDRHINTSYVLLICERRCFSSLRPQLHVPASPCCLCNTTYTHTDNRHNRKHMVNSWFMVWCVRTDMTPLSTSSSHSRFGAGKCYTRKRACRCRRCACTHVERAHATTRTDEKKKVCAYACWQQDSMRRHAWGHPAQLAQQESIKSNRKTHQHILWTHACVYGYVFVCVCVSLSRWGERCYRDTMPD